MSPGDYEVRFTLPGFRTTTRSGLQLSGGMQFEVNAALDAKLEPEAEALHISSD